MTELIVSPHFTNHADATRSEQRLSFQFVASGSKQAGVLYVTMDIDGDPMNSAQRAADIAGKRAGADTVTLHAIVKPVR